MDPSANTKSNEKAENYSERSFKKPRLWTDPFFAFDVELAS
jgi:hypothetical protein